MTPEEVDQLTQICSDACQTETGKRLWQAIITDGVFERIIGDHPDPAAIAAEMGNEKIIEVAKKEINALTDDEKEQLATDAHDHMQDLVILVAKASFKAMKNGIINSSDLTADFVIVAAAAQCVAKATK
jgi:hypothetical protein